MPLVALLLLAAAPPGRPLFYWGARAPVVVAEREEPAEPGPEARVSEVHAARDGEDLVLRFSFDRQVREALLADGQPVSGRLRAVLYIDADDDRATGLAEGSRDLRTGAERRVEVGSLFLGADPEEGREASAAVAIALHSLRPDGSRRLVWRGDDQKDPSRVSLRGEWVEARLPAERVGLGGRSRFVLTEGDRAWDGRFAAEPAPKPEPTRRP